jgi:hypothetical protein
MSDIKTVKTHVWEAISPITNELHIGHTQPTLEQAFWTGFEYCGEFRNYTLSMTEGKPSVGLNNPNAFKYRIQWTDADDHLLEKYVATEAEANEITEAINNSDCWQGMREMLDLLEFKMW